MTALTYFLTIGGFGVGVVAGYGLARLDAIYVYVRKLHDAGGSLVMESRQPGFFARQKSSHAEDAGGPGKIEIDTRTVVTEINTAGLQRASNAEMGQTTTAADSTINQSVSRLSQLKGK